MAASSLSPFIIHEACMFCMLTMSDCMFFKRFVLQLVHVSALLFCQLHVLCTGITTPTIHQLTEELVGMNDWYSLGVALLVPVSKLQEIMALSPLGGIARWRIDLLQHWLDSTPTALWSDIITALEKIGHQTLSARLRTVYLPSATTTTGI